VTAIGLGCFGPLDLDPESKTYGSITNTPKRVWQDQDILGWLKHELRVPVGFDSDVNAAALGEGRWGVAKQVQNFVYFTVGTGIGGGTIWNGNLFPRKVHPEMGHLRVRRHVHDAFEGVCPFHGDCLEGLASGPAMAARWGIAPEKLEMNHLAWEWEVFYLAQVAAAATIMLRPEMIVFGGGVSKAPGLIDRIDQEFTRQLGGYLQKTPRVVHTALESAGLLGALILAENAETISQ
jgi:fructokinase